MIYYNIVAVFKSFNVRRIFPKFAYIPYILSVIKSFCSTKQYL